LGYQLDFSLRQVDREILFFGEKNMEVGSVDLCWGKRRLNNEQINVEEAEQS
jgi:hypothetical protein